jgi:serine protease AprX
VYIADLVGTSTPGDGGAWNATVTVLIRDENGDPVPNATVSGSWSKGFYASSSCTTDASGQCMVEQTGIDNKTRRVSFNVDGVSHLTLTYNAALNVVPTIRVDRP